MHEGVKYVTGDLFDHLEDPGHYVKIIAHIVNNEGAWGFGFVIPLGKKYPLARDRYFEAFSGSPSHPRKSKCLYTGTPMTLGNTQWVQAEHNRTEGWVYSQEVWVANMVAQQGTGSQQPIRYNALCRTMTDVAQRAANWMSMGQKVEIIAPLFGSGLAGGNWDFIEELICEIWVNNKIPTTIYQLPGQELREATTD